MFSNGKYVRTTIEEYRENIKSNNTDSSQQTDIDILMDLDEQNQDLISEDFGDENLLAANEYTNNATTNQTSDITDNFRSVNANFQDNQYDIQITVNSDGTRVYEFSTNGYATKIGETSISFKMTEDAYGNFISGSANGTITRNLQLIDFTIEAGGECIVEEPYVICNLEANANLSPSDDDIFSTDSTLEVSSFKIQAQIPVDDLRNKDLSNLEIYSNASVVGISTDGPEVWAQGTLWDEWDNTPLDQRNAEYRPGTENWNINVNAKIDQYNQYMQDIVGDDLDNGILDYFDGTSAVVKANSGEKIVFYKPDQSTNEKYVLDNAGELKAYSIQDENGEYQEAPLPSDENINSDLRIFLDGEYTETTPVYETQTETDISSDPDDLDNAKTDTTTEPDNNEISEEELDEAIQQDEENSQSSDEEDEPSEEINPEQYPGGGLGHEDDYDSDMEDETPDTSNQDQNPGGGLGNEDDYDDDEEYFPDTENMIQTIPGGVDFNGDGIISVDESNLSAGIVSGVSGLISANNDFTKIEQLSFDLATDLITTEIRTGYVFNSNQTYKINTLTFFWYQNKVTKKNTLQGTKSPKGSLKNFNTQKRLRNSLHSNSPRLLSFEYLSFLALCNARDGYGSAEALFYDMGLKEVA